MFSSHPLFKKALALTLATFLSLTANPSQKYRKTYPLKHIHSLDVSLIPGKIIIKRIGTNKKPSLTIISHEKDKHIVSKIIVTNHKKNLFISLSPYRKDKRNALKISGSKTIYPVFTDPDSGAVIEYGPNSKFDPDIAELYDYENIYTAHFINKKGKKVKKKFHDRITLILRIPTPLHNITLGDHIEATIEKGFFTSKKPLPSFQVTLKNSATIKGDNSIYAQNIKLNLSKKSRFEAKTCIAKNKCTLNIGPKASAHIHSLSAKTIESTIASSGHLYLSKVKMTSFNLTIKQGAYLSINFISGQIFSAQAGNSAEISFTEGHLHTLKINAQNDTIIKTQNLKAQKIQITKKKNKHQIILSILSFFQRNFL